MESRIRREVYVRFGRRLPETYWRKPARRRVPTSYLLLANASFIATDPKGELVRAVAPLLLQKGYVVKVFDLIEPSHSDSYNPFRYIRKDSDVFKLINNFIQNTTPKGSKSNDPFWESATRSLAVRSQRTNNKYRCLDNW